MPEMTPAQELREAARLIRERAQAASAAPWCVRVLPARTTGTLHPSPAQYMVIAGPVNVANAGEPDAPFIAAMHPGVALALADWLDRTAADDEFGEVTGFDEALAVARAYLGTEEASDA